MTPRTQNLLLLHGVVLIFGFTGILGKLISIDAEPSSFGGSPLEVVRQPCSCCSASGGCPGTLRRWGRRGLLVGLLPPIG